MKITSLFSAILATALSTVPAYAVPAAAGDLILGFKATGGQGASACLEVNLGPASDYYNAAAGSATVVNRLAVADLAAAVTYGTNWATRSDLFWGIVGTTGVSAVNGVPARTIWASKPETTPGTASEPWVRRSTAGQQNSSGAIATMYSNAPGSISAFPATANSAYSSVVTATLGGSWTVQDELVAGTSFRLFSPSVMNAINTFPTAGSTYDGTAYTVLDLWELRPSTTPDLPAALVGAFGLNSAGKLVFSRDITKFAPPTSGPVQLGEPTIASSGAGYTITLGNVPAGSYVLQRSTTMGAASWTTLATQSPASGTLTFSDNTPPAGRGFYRIAQAP